MGILQYSGFGKNQVEIIETFTTTTRVNNFAFSHLVGVCVDLLLPPGRSSGNAWCGDDSPYLSPARDVFFFQKRVQRAKRQTQQCEATLAGVTGKAGENGQHSGAIAKWLTD